MNLGSVQSVTLGPALNLTDGSLSAMYISATMLTPHYAVACYDTLAGSVYGVQCNLVETNPLMNTWEFNDPVDCVNGYGCTGRRMMLETMNSTVKKAAEKVEEETA